MAQQKTLENNLTDLPKWAQQQISVLQIRLKESKAEIDRLLENPESNTVLGSTFKFGEEPIRYLKNNQEITFVLNGGKLSARIEKDGLCVSAQALEDAELCVRPQVSNCVKIVLK